ncbi:hypothetical protein SMACR_05392 [Sordaria macrospora]|uniref:WGS project CABT00000000 data, contig 2.6 n=2 Tax=Sordaria macrospora TaxID=5147 RepID=F7VST5_SORMK|nr:uncharacterized protein SMAC_05392 [Sordaria macrospora k-hell]KAA8630671.1 hypothetical protein SMACR_05392 [Sordaria macrospora]KAH7628435.1 hypothetical protein B0T09DRAFT_343802 [Sordaria sp. MPI-SDFR-AT-0083]WPJ57616.1 hypothetical protein SMAC4_05392 [Sordaria macrospora]CCC08752.1 unnamed protein product [Sordaria macrospora k-hell]
MGWTVFLLIYLFGGLTFLPLLVVCILLHAHFSFPYRPDADQHHDPEADDLIQPGDDLDALKAEQKKDGKPRVAHHDDGVASGYFAVCREYTPMGINAKPIERSTPVGSTTVAAPSPSVYQTMYRSIFDRKSSSPSPIDHKNGPSQRPKKAGNVFYVVLRHGHLMLFDDDEQLEVRHVVALAHHEVSIYSGEEVTPEGELYIKRNAICLSRKTDGVETGPDSQVSKPFYLFSENCSAKEDFYFALLRNQEQQALDTGNEVPSPIQFEVKNIINLVQRLHSSEEHMQTRWLNAMIGRIFLGIYKTKDIENAIREKLTKKISRVKRPAFLSKIAIKGIDTGESAPFITNPRLRDLTVEGECCIEADVRYTGNFRLEVAATARIDLGARFKAREVDLVLAVVVRKLEGHVLFKIKPPPSNRLWFSFQQAPKMEMTIEPIVSSRQITYTVILRQIEKQIKEVMAETLVLPFWDDMPFFNTEHKKWRGGIFHDDVVVSTMDLETAAAQEGDLDEVERLEATHDGHDHDVPHVEKSHSMSSFEKTLDKKPSISLFGRMTTKAKGDTYSASTTSLSTDNKSEFKTETKSETHIPPPIRVVSITHPPTPTVSTDAINADVFKPSSSPPDESAAASAMATLSIQAQSPTRPQPPHSPLRPSVTSKSSGQSSGSSSSEATDAEKDLQDFDKRNQARRNTATSAGSQEESRPRSPASSIRGSVKSQTGTIKGIFARRDTVSSTSGAGTPNHPDSGKKAALAAAFVTNAAASAKRWGLNALQRHTNNDGPPGRSASFTDDHPSGLDLNQPMGRGQPLPPPGTPLPMPDRRSNATSISIPRRKPIPPPDHSLQQRKSSTPEDQDHKLERRPVPPPPLPKRRQYRAEQQLDDDGNNVNMLVVAAPAESEPTTPMSEAHDTSPSKPSADTVEAKRQSEVDNSAQEDIGSKTYPKHSAPAIRISKTTSQEGHENVKTLSPALSAGVDDDDEFSAWMDDAGPAEDIDTTPAPTANGSVDKRASP